MKRTILSLGTILFAVAMVTTGTIAFFGDTESSTGNTFAAGMIDLMIDNESYYNGAVSTSTSWQLANLNDGQGPSTDGAYLFFDFNDLKPDDEGEDTISIHINDNPAWACMDITVSEFNDNGCNEPEAGDGDVTCNDPGEGEGELQNEIEFIWWEDDGDNVLEDDEDVFFQPQTFANLNLQIPLADASGDAIFGDEPLDPTETYYIGKAWCFGTLTADETTVIEQDGLGNEGDNGPLDRGTGIECDGTLLDNQTQTDSVQGEVNFYAVQARSNEGFLCNAPTGTQCELEESYASDWEEVNQGRRKDGSVVAGDRSDPDAALGAPQSSGTPYDNPVVAGSFFSLGFPSDEFDDSDGSASIVLTFDNLIVNGPGADLKLWEVTGGSDYPDEKVDVFVGNTPAGPWTQVGFGVARDAEIELGGVLSAQYVLIEDASDVNEFEDTADGYDLDAVQALNCIVPDVDEGPGDPEPS